MSDPNIRYPADDLAGYVHGLLRERMSDDAKITVETRVWEDGDYHAKAFSTVWNCSSRDDFAREVVYYNSIDDATVHAVEHYFSGHHEEHFEYVLGVIDE